ncbi:MAG TPA: hypothetical protein VFO57_05045, partial [Burkholderiales bacterium]|nr:hypothetical protein [Burkholderiales bacterium]
SKMSVLALAGQDLVADDDRAKVHKIDINRQDAKAAKKYNNNNQKKGLRRLLHLPARAYQAIKSVAWIFLADLAS